MITSGSGLERFVMCRASNVLHRVLQPEGNKGTSRGKEAHGYLQRIGEGMKPEEAIELVDDRFQEACKAIDLESIKDVLGLTPELTLAYCPDTDTARVLGSGLEREYEAAGLQDDEIPLTLDVAGLDNPESPTLGIVVDWKTGWQRLAKAERNWQMRGGALALARAFDLDEVRVQLVHLRDDHPATREFAVFTAADLAVIASEIQLRWRLAIEDRRRYVETRSPPDATMGSWCGYCPSYHACDAQTGLIRAAVGGDETDDLMRQSPLPPERVAEAFRRLRALREPLKRLEQAIYASARERPVLIEVTPDGTQIFLGMTEVVGNERLEAGISRQVVSEMLDEKAAEEVSKFEVSKGRIEEAVKKRVGRGFGAAKFRAVIAEIKKRGGTKQSVKHEVDLYPIRRDQIAAPKKAS